MITAHIDATTIQNGPDAASSATFSSPGCSVNDPRSPAWNSAVIASTASNWIARNGTTKLPRRIPWRSSFTVIGPNRSGRSLVIASCIGEIMLGKCRHGK
jgi:hypothetical protein